MKDTMFGERILGGPLAEGMQNEYIFA